MSTEMVIERLKQRRRDCIEMLKLDIDLMRRAELMVQIDELTKEIQKKEGEITNGK